MEFQNTINEFKASENARILTMFQRDEELQKLTSAWSADILKPIECGTPAPAAKSDRWRWLWEQVEVDESELFGRAGIIHGKAKLLQAIKLGIIYPDGSIHKWAEGQLVHNAKQAMR